MRSSLRFHLEVLRRLWAISPRVYASGLPHRLRLAGLTLRSAAVNLTSDQLLHLVLLDTNENKVQHAEREFGERCTRVDPLRPPIGPRKRIGLLLGLAPQLQLLGIEIGPQFRALLAVTQTHVLEAHPRGLLLLKARTQANDIAQVDGAQALGDPVGQSEADPSHQGAHPDPGETTRSRLLGCSGLGHLNRGVGG